MSDDVPNKSMSTAQAEVLAAEMERRGAHTVDEIKMALPAALDQVAETARTMKSASRDPFFRTAFAEAVHGRMQQRQRRESQSRGQYEGAQKAARARVYQRDEEELER